MSKKSGAKRPGLKSLMAKHPEPKCRGETSRVRNVQVQSPAAKRPVPECPGTKSQGAKRPG